MKSVQSKVADTILQRAQVVFLGGRRFKMRPATFGTMVLTSEAIANLPERIAVPKDGESVISVLLRAKDFTGLADMCAVLVMGAKRVEKGFLGGFIRKRFARWIRLHATNEEMRNCVMLAIGRFDLGDFFATTTFLQGMETTKPTKVVKTRATAPGQS